MTGKALGHISIGRAVVDSIPHFQQLIPGCIDDVQVQQRQTVVNQKASCRRRARTPNLQIGDTVLLKDNFSGSKFRLLFDKNPWTLVRRHGYMVVAQRGDSTITRNVLPFKKFHSPTQSMGEDVEPPMSDSDQPSLPDSDDDIPISQPESVRMPGPVAE
ncbi:hypothetical protein NDU88_004995 [Pleurodeles waltl]|uniref:Uncharacterized protein n=1 Tax=Pleurodeles waltl TaxID=8319 RepID=A0AAV7QE27_PLEWA|nr:hypothetical protein NDU88_004995 [Pleurodeles waltl]